MNKVINFAAKPRTVAPYLGTEDEAIEVAKILGSEIRAGSTPRGRQGILPHQELHRLAQSGILGITVPPEYGGTDISNPFLAEVLAILSEADSSIGQILQSHFYILEMLRIAGTEEQKRYFFAKALSGDIFANAFAERDIEAKGSIRAQLMPDGSGYRILGQKCYSHSAMLAGWITILTQDAQNRSGLAIVQRNTDGLIIVSDRTSTDHQTATATVVIDNIYVSPDSVIPHHKVIKQPTPLESLGQLLHAATDLGRARAAFADMIDLAKTKSRGNRNLDIEIASVDALTIAKAGSIAVRIEAAAAVVERAGRKIDMAQVSPSASAASDALLAAASARILSTEAALEAATVYLEFSQAFATNRNVSLDRQGLHAHTVHDPKHWKYHAIGDFHLNDRLPEQNK